MAWCADNLRDCQAWLDEDLHMSTVSSEASRLFDATLRQYVTWIECDQLGGIEKTTVDMLKADPDFVLGKALSYGVDLIGTRRTTRLDKEFAKEIDDLVAEVCVNNKVTPREKLHVVAVKQFADGFVNDACATWEEILRQHPNDMLALKLAHDSYFYMGNSAEIRDSIARVLPKWKKEDPLYSWLHGMIAFGYEENNQFELAEKAAKQALSLQKQDAWATHALSHVYEMTVRYAEGIRLMSDTVDDWQPCNMLACHNFWHWAVYHIEKMEYDVALGIYDRECAKRVQSSALLDIVDATSLLYRLELEGVNVGDRWEPLYAICERHLDEHILTFNDVMMRMAVLGHDSAEDTKRIHQSMLDYIE